MKYVDDSDVEKDIIEGLEDVEISDSRDHKSIIHQIKKLVKNVTSKPMEKNEKDSSEPEIDEIDDQQKKRKIDGSGEKWE